MYNLRTKETHDAYEIVRTTQNFKENCPLCSEKEVICEFTHWKLVRNLYPYDKVAEIHDMIVPKHHVTEEELTGDEEHELFELKHTFLNENYILLIEALKNSKSIPAHFHLHLIVPKEQI